MKPSTIYKITLIKQGRTNVEVAKELNTSAAYINKVLSLMDKGQCDKLKTELAVQIENKVRKIIQSSHHKTELV